MKKYAQFRDDVDLIVMDVVMPRKNGKEAYDEIMEMAPSAKVLFVSGYSNDIINKKGILDESLNFISKSSSPVAFLNKVREVLDRK